jgi:hypothetical protein
MRSAVSVLTIWRGWRKEQLFADVLLQQLDLIAHRGLGHAQFLRRARETAMPGDGLETRAAH